MTRPLFLLGAGFNADAAKEAGLIYSPYNERIDAGYPLGAETVRLCFGLRSLPEGKFFEDLFADALESKNFGPLDRLAERLYHADYHLAHGLASANTSNCYRRFFEKFTDANFLTFNCDSLPETFLFKMEKWYPHDGYGVRVEARVPVVQSNLPRYKSASHVLHLHGSLCIRTSESEIVGNPSGGALVVPREHPLYTFDPSSISANFHGRHYRHAGFDPVRDRVIAPIPDKGEELKRAFVRESYTRALAMVCAAENLVAIGYSFSPYDQVSYGKVLKALTEAHRKLVLVSPEARKLEARLRCEYASLEIEPVEKGFASWVAASFPGVN